MATDIAFVVGVLALFGSRVPFGLKILLLSLAIVGDLRRGAGDRGRVHRVYRVGWLGAAAGGLALTYALNRAGLRQVGAYVVVGAFVWLAVYKSGVHPTVAGVLLGLLTPTSAWIRDRALADVIGRAARRLSAPPAPDARTSRPLAARCGGCVESRSGPGARCPATSKPKGWSRSDASREKVASRSKPSASCRVVCERPKAGRTGRGTGCRRASDVSVPSAGHRTLVPRRGDDAEFLRKGRMARHRVRPDAWVADRCPCPKPGRWRTAARGRPAVEADSDGPHARTHSELQSVRADGLVGVALGHGYGRRGGRVASSGEVSKWRHTGLGPDRGAVSESAAGLLAHVIVSKYCDHLPLYRQEAILGRLGWRVTRSTLCDQVLACAGVLEPLYRLMCDRVLWSAALHADDTSVVLLAPRRTAHAWVYVGDPSNPYTVFDLSVGRSRDAPTAFLEGFKGYVHVDGYAGYNPVYEGGATHVGC